MITYSDSASGVEITVTRAIKVAIAHGIENGTREMFEFLADCQPYVTTTGEIDAGDVLAVLGY